MICVEKNTTKEVWKRDELYVGRLIKLGEYNKNNYKDIKNIKSLSMLEMMDMYGCYDCRKVLFTINEEKQTNDILFSSPNYPIFDTTEDIYPGTILIEEYVNLKNILIYLEFNEEITVKDIVRIYNYILKCNNSLPNIKDKVDYIRGVLRKTKAEGEPVQMSNPKLTSRFNPLIFRNLGLLQSNAERLFGNKKAKIDLDIVLPSNDDLTKLIDISVLEVVPSYHEDLKNIRKKIKGLWL